MDYLNNKLPDQNIEAEESLLASLIIDNRLFEYCEFLEPDEFYKSANKKIYATIVEMKRNKEPVDIVTLPSLMIKKNILDECGGISYLLGLVDYAPAFNTKRYVELIKECALTRRIKTECVMLLDSELTGEKLLGKSQSCFLDIKSTSRDDNIKSVRDIMSKHMDRLEKANSTQEGMFYKTGFPNIDRNLRVKDAKLIIIAARPKMGKTAMLVTMSRNLDKEGVKVGVLSIEMPEAEIIDRWLSQESQVDSVKLGRYKGLNDRDLQSVSDAASVLYESKIMIDETGSLDIVDVERKCRKLKQLGCQVIFIDQLSSIRNREIKSGDILSLYSENCSRIAALKKELNLPIFLLHQLNRDVKNRANKEPIVTDLKQAGKVEEDADAVIFIHRPEEYETDEAGKEILRGKTILDLALNRSGPKYKDKKIIFDHATTYFYQGMS